MKNTSNPEHLILSESQQITIIHIICTNCWNQVFLTLSRLELNCILFKWVLLRSTIFQLFYYAAFFIYPDVLVSLHYPTSVTARVTSDRLGCHLGISSHVQKNLLLWNAGDVRRLGGKVWKCGVVVAVWYVVIRKCSEVLRHRMMRHGFVYKE